MFVACCGASCIFSYSAMLCPTLFLFTGLTFCCYSPFLLSANQYNNTQRIPGASYKLADSYRLMVVGPALFIPLSQQPSRSQIMETVGKRGTKLFLPHCSYLISKSCWSVERGRARYLWSKQAPGPRRRGGGRWLVSEEADRKKVVNLWRRQTPIRPSNGIRISRRSFGIVSA